MLALAQWKSSLVVRVFHNFSSLLRAAVHQDSDADLSISNSNQPSSAFIIFLA